MGQIVVSMLAEVCSKEAGQLWLYYGLLIASRGRHR